MNRNKATITTLLAILLVNSAEAQLMRREGEGSRRADVGRNELNARSIIDSAVEAFENGQDDRGVKALEQVIKQYPDTRSRYRASLLLGEHHMARREFDEAILELREVASSQDDVECARALGWIGICHYEKNAYDQAVSHLRQVINTYPGTLSANDAYYYIGLCHYHRKRWGKAKQAFEMVGTAVADREENGETLAEAGRRLFVRVRDKDLPVLARLGEELYVTLRAKSGDSERVLLEPVGRSREDFVASIRTATKATQPNDGVLSVRGGDLVNVTYVDQNTLEGKSAEKRLAEVRLVSTAGLAVTDGAYRQSVGAVATEQPVFIRLKDLDLDTSPDCDEVRIEVVSRYAVEEEEELGDGVDLDGVDLDRAERSKWVERSTSFVTLIETTPTSGLFQGSFIPHALGGSEDEGPGGKLAVRSGDLVEVRYIDSQHLAGSEPIALSAETMIVETGRPQVETIISVSSNPEVQSKKLLLEAQLRRMLAQVFQDMGLLDRAKEKSNAGLERVEEVLKMHAVNPLPTQLVERSFETKWNLYLAQGDVKQAIAACKALIELYPKSTLADQAFLKIGQAYYESDQTKEVAQAIPVLKMVIGMKDAPGQAEAAFLLGQVYEKLHNRTPNASQAWQAQAVAQYMSCTEQFSDSPFAAEALKKVIEYHNKEKDYRRCAELLERVCRDYQDQDWLHEMYKDWGVVLLRMGHYEAGTEKLQQVIEEYPESDSAVTASKLLGQLEKRKASSAGAAEDSNDD